MRKGAAKKGKLLPLVLHGDVQSAPLRWCITVGCAGAAECRLVMGRVARRLAGTRLRTTGCIAGGSHGNTQRRRLAVACHGTSMRVSQGRVSKSWNGQCGLWRRVIRHGRSDVDRARAGDDGRFHWGLAHDAAQFAARIHDQQPGCKASRWTGFGLGNR